MTQFIYFSCSLDPSTPLSLFTKKHMIPTFLFPFALFKSNYIFLFSSINSHVSITLAVYFSLIQFVFSCNLVDHTPLWYLIISFRSRETQFWNTTTRRQHSKKKEFATKISEITTGTLAPARMWSTILSDHSLEKGKKRRRWGNGAERERCKRHVCTCMTMGWRSGSASFCWLVSLSSVL